MWKIWIDGLSLIAVKSMIQFCDNFRYQPSKLYGEGYYQLERREIENKSEK